MTLKEFFKKNPVAVKEAAKCKSVKEFTELVGKLGLTFDNNEKAKKAFDIVKGSNDGELSDDDLSAVSGGLLVDIGSDTLTGYTETGEQHEIPDDVIIGWYNQIMANQKNGKDSNKKK